MSQPIVSLSGPTALRAVYDEYAAMLYGYIFEVVRDKQLAEGYLLQVFNDLPQQLQDILIPNVNVYHQLQRSARQKLAGFFGTTPHKIIDNGVNGHIPSRPNRFLEGMSPEQKIVFCNIHYYGKSVVTVAGEMDRTEEEVRKYLQQAFALIRRAA